MGALVLQEYWGSIDWVCVGALVVQEYWGSIDWVCVGALVVQEYWGSIDWRVWVHWLYRSIGEVLTGECGCIGSTGVLGKY